MYPDLNDDNNGASTTTYQSTTASGNVKKKKQENDQENEKDNCCVSGAKCWITLIGGLNLLLGLFVAICALYAKFFYSDYENLSATLPDGGIWMILGFGVVLAVCSVVLLLSTCMYEKPGFKLILVVFAIILAILLFLEIVSGGVLVWGLGVISLPKSDIGDAAADRLLDARSLAINATYAECCIKNTPPYDIVNISKIESVCLWPQSAAAVKQACTGVDVLECVCKDPTAYGAYFGLFLQSSLSWVAIVTITFAVLLLIGLISTCVLIWAKNKKKNATYKPEEN